MLDKMFLKDKRVIVMGLGLHGGGVGVAKWLAKHRADILITDIKTRAQLKDSIAQLAKFKNIKHIMERQMSVII